MISTQGSLRFIQTIHPRIILFNFQDGRNHLKTFRCLLKYFSKVSDRCKKRLKNGFIKISTQYSWILQPLLTWRRPEGREGPPIRVFDPATLVRSVKSTFFLAYEFICVWSQISSRSAKQPGWRSPPIVTIVKSVQQWGFCTRRSTTGLGSYRHLFIAIYLTMWSSALFIDIQCTFCWCTFCCDPVHSSLRSSAFLIRIQSTFAEYTFRCNSVHSLFTEIQCTLHWDPVHFPLTSRALFAECTLHYDPVHSSLRSSALFIDTQSTFHWMHFLLWFIALFTEIQCTFHWHPVHFLLNELFTEIQCTFHWHPEHFSLSALHWDTVHSSL